MQILPWAVVEAEFLNSRCAECMVYGRGMSGNCERAVGGVVCSIILRSDGSQGGDVRTVLKHG
jgi:hypothetical protein